MGRVARVLACALGLVAVACSHHDLATTPRAVPGPEVPDPGYYASPGPVPTPIRRELRWRKPHSALWEIALPARVHPDVSEVPLVQDPLEILFMTPVPAERRPVVLMMPILANSTLLMPEFASAFVGQGYAAAILRRKAFEFDPYRSVAQAELELRVQIMRARQAIDWLVTQPEVDPERVGVFGISAGGILGVDLMAADPRVDAGVFVFAGGPMADVIVDTAEGQFVEQREILRRERGWTDERMKEELRRIVRTDPVLLAPRVRREDVLLFMTLDDESVPTRNQRLLWEALGQPEAYELRGGHYLGVGLYLPHVMAKARRFLGRRLGSP